MNFSYVRLCKSLGNIKMLQRKKQTYSQSLLDALEMVKWPVQPSEILGFANLAMVVSAAVFAVATVISFLLNFNPLYFLVVTLILPIALNHLITEYPKNAAKLKVLQALGESPKTLLFLIVPLKQNPNLEEAVRFAVEYTEGEISNDFKDALWRVWSGKVPNLKDELPKIGEKWGKYSPEFKRALYLIRSSLAEKQESRRVETIDKSISVALQGIISKNREYVAALFMPTLILFSFGTVIPLMFISMLPLMSIFGLQLSSPFEISVLLAATIVAIFVYSNKVVSKKPPAFSQPRIPEIKGLPPKGRMLFFGKMIPAWAFIPAISFIIGFPGIMYLLTANSIIFIGTDNAFGLFISSVNTLSIIWGIGMSIALYCYFSAKPKKKVRDQIKQMDSEVLDVMYHTANRMSENRSPEEALKFASESTKGTLIGKLFTQTMQMIERRNITIEEAFFDPKIGTLNTVYSSTVKSILRLFVSSVKKGVKTAAEIIFITITHFNELKDSEKELMRMIQKNISMLRATIVAFAPIVCGVVVALHDIIQSALVKAAEGMQTTSGTMPFNFVKDIASISPEVLQLIVGIYMLLLAIILIRYISLIENGPDEVSMKFEIGKSLPIALSVFTIVLLATRTLLGGSVA